MLGVLVDSSPQPLSLFLSPSSYRLGRGFRLPVPEHVCPRVVRRRRSFSRRRSALPSRADQCPAWQSPSRGGDSGPRRSARTVDVMGVRKGCRSSCMRVVGWLLRCGALCVAGDRSSGLLSALLVLRCVARVDAMLPEITGRAGIPRTTGKKRGSWNGVLVAMRERQVKRL